MYESQKAEAFTLLMCVLQHLFDFDKNYAYVGGQGFLDLAILSVQQTARIYKEISTETGKQVLLNYQFNIIQNTLVQLVQEQKRHSALQLLFIREQTNAVLPEVPEDFEQFCFYYYYFQDVIDLSQLKQYYDSQQRTLLKLITEIKP